jgi:hypothetical protein
MVFLDWYSLLDARIVQGISVVTAAEEMNRGLSGLASGCPKRRRMRKYSSIVVVVRAVPWITTQHLGR